MKQVRVGVIGCGGIAERAHIPNLLAEPQVRLEALSDINEGKLLAIQQKFNFPKDKSYTDYTKVLDLKDVDAVVIATPTYTHAEIALKAIEAGKHVFVEKPLSVTVAQAEAIVESAKQAKVKVMVGYQHRFVSSHRIAKRYLRTGKIGVPFFGEVHSESLIVKPEEGILLDYGVHLIDLLCWYLDDSKVEEVAALSYSDKESAKEKHALILMRFSNGVLGRIGVFFLEGYSSWSASDRYVKVLGTRGKLVVSLTGPTITFYKEGSLMSRLRGPHTFMPKGAVQEQLPLTDAAYREEMHDFIQSILQDRKPSVDADQGLMVQKILEAVQQSIAEKKFVKVNL
jgi:UDP-N-acetylglucosamine 3-dehydrogenase